MKRHSTCGDCTFLRPLAITVPPSKPYCLRYPRPVVRMPDDTACGEFRVALEEVSEMKFCKPSAPKPAKEGRKKPDGA